MSDKPKENSESTSSSLWTDAKVKELIKLFNEGLSATKIAEILGERFSRNAVIGKLNRLELKHNNRKGTHKTIVGEKPTKKRAIPTPKSTDKEEFFASKDLIEIFQAPIDPIEPGKPVTIMSLTDKTCRYPIGDPFEDDFHFCGKDSEPESPYCSEHCEIVYQPIHNRRREQQAKAAETMAKR